MAARTALREMKMILEPIEGFKKAWVIQPISWTEKDIKMVEISRLYICVLLQKKTHIKFTL